MPVTDSREHSLAAVAIFCLLFSITSWTGSTKATQPENPEKISCPYLMEPATALSIVNPEDQWWLRWGKRAAEKVLGLSELSGIYEQTRPLIQKSDDFWRLALEHLEIETQVTGDVSQLKEGQPTVVVSNHPYGFVDGITLANIVATQRQDYLILGNSLLMGFPEIREKILPLEIMDSNRSDMRAVARKNLQSLRRAQTHLQNGGAIIIFPAGVVSTARTLGEPAIEGQWEPTVAKLIRESNAPVLPVFFHGQNPDLFHLASRAPGALSEILRVILFPKMALAMRQSTIRVQVGQILEAEMIETLKSFGILSTNSDVAEYLREATLRLSENPQLLELALGHKVEDAQTATRVITTPIAEEIPPDVLENLIATETEAERLTLLAEGRSTQIPFATGPELNEDLLHQLGVVREKTFRPEGEGSGNALDIDHFDRIYSHILAWHFEKQQLAGAYRIHNLADIVAGGNFDDIYSHAQFNYSPEFFTQLTGNVAELGRSIVAPDFQGGDTLALLWKGIGEYLDLNHDIQHMIGPVSISGDYSLLAQTLIYEWLMHYHGGPQELRQALSPRIGFPDRLDLDPEKLSEFLEAHPNMADLEKAIVNIEGRKLPSLVKYYTKIVKAQFLAFDFDPDFNTLDGLILVNLADLPEPIIARFLGDKERARAFHCRVNPKACDQK